MGTPSPESSGREPRIDPSGNLSESFDFAVPIAGETEADQLLRMWVVLWTRRMRNLTGPEDDKLLGDLHATTVMHLASLYNR